jgi:Cyclic nucleotide-binding domain/N-acyl amino acid synthase FeeM
VSRAKKVIAATSQEELEAIWRFRYEVYIEELKRDYPGADHDRRWLRDDDDEQPYAVNLYLGPLDQIVGVQRLLVWPPGEIPEDYHQLFSMDVFPGIEDAVIAEAGRLMIRPTARGTHVFPKLVNAMREQWVERDVKMCFLYCVPGLVKHYRMTLGARPYDGRLIPAGFGVGIPMVVIVSDQHSFEACDETVSNPGARGSDAPEKSGFDVSRFSHVLEGDSVPVKLDEAAVWELFQHQLLEDESARPAFLNSLSSEAVRRLISSGFILDPSPGDVIAKRGTEEREMYVILDGVFEVISQDKRLAILEKGDLFGEIAFFTQTGERCASVRAVTKGEVLVLRRNFLKELTRIDPEAGFQILTNIGTVMADRIVSLNQALLAARDA